MKLLILGAGQYGIVTKEIAEAMCCFECIDFLDDNNEVAVGKIAEYKKFLGQYDSAIVAIGNSQLRLSYLEMIRCVGYNIPTLVHPQSYISSSAKVGCGCIVEALVGVNAETEIGIGCILSMGCMINHNVVVQDGCHVDCGAVISARAIVPFGTKVSNGMVFEG